MVITSICRDGNVRELRVPSGLVGPAFSSFGGGWLDVICGFCKAETLIKEGRE